MVEPLFSAALQTRPGGRSISKAGDGTRAPEVAADVSICPAYSVQSMEIGLMEIRLDGLQHLWIDNGSKSKTRVRAVSAAIEPCAVERSSEAWEVSSVFSWL